MVCSGGRRTEIEARLSGEGVAFVSKRVDAAAKVLEVLHVHLRGGGKSVGTVVTHGNGRREGNGRLGFGRMGERFHGGMVGWRARWKMRMEGMA